MPGIDILMGQFDDPDLPPEVSQKFKDVSLLLAQLPAPRNLQTVRNLLDARQSYVVFYANLNSAN